MGESNQTQALHEVGQFLRSKEDARTNFEQSLHHAIFWDDLLMREVLWKTNSSKTMTCIQTYGYCYFYGNIKIAMIKEGLGIGPERYCIAFNRSPTFYSKLKLLMCYLPREKMFLYPSGARLEGPFLHEPWLSRGRQICSNPSITLDEYLANFILY